MLISYLFKCLHRFYALAYHASQDPQIAFLYVDIAHMAGVSTYHIAKNCQYLNLTHAPDHDFFAVSSTPFERTHHIPTRMIVVDFLPPFHRVDNMANGIMNS